MAVAPGLHFQWPRSPLDNVLVVEATMPDQLEPLIRDLLTWLAKGPKPYAEVMDAWRTSCPRLTVWEDAIDRNLVERKSIAGRGPCIEVTTKGLAWLATRQ
jgi:hypothetical protein